MNYATAIAACSFCLLPTPSPFCGKAAFYIYFATPLCVLFSLDPRLRLLMSLSLPLPQIVSPGSRGGCLWGLVFADGSYAGGCGYPSAPDLTWDQATCTLSLIYATAGSEPLKRPLGRAMPYAARSWAMNACVPNVTATLTVDTASSVDGVGRLVTSASVALPTSCPVVATELLWLSDLVLPVATIADTFLPLLPGINLTAAFYRQPTPHVLSNTYPGRSWAADIVSWSVAGGARMASISPRRPSDAITAVNAAVVGQAADDWFYHHTYPFALHAGERFTTPPLLLAVGMFDFEVKWALGKELTQAARCSYNKKKG